MPVLAIKPQIDLEEIWKAETGGREPRPYLRALVESLVPEAQALASGAAIYELFPVADVRHNRVTLANGKRLVGEDAARILGAGDEIAVGIVTIGPALEKRVEELFAEDESPRAYLLDSLGTAAVTNVVQQVCSLLAELYEARGLPVGFPISPGNPGWPLSEQQALFQLVDASAVGVNLTEVCLMLPRKSVSFAVAAGHKVSTIQDGSQCDLCALREACRYRETQSSAGL